MYLYFRFSDILKISLIHLQIIHNFRSEINKKYIFKYKASFFLKKKKRSKKKNCGFFFEIPTLIHVFV